MSGRKRIVLLVGFVCLFPAFGALGIWLSTPNPGVNLDNAHRLRYGMTLGQVQAIFGDPGRETGGGGFGTAFVQAWTGDGLEVEVVFALESRGVASILYRREGRTPAWDWTYIEPLDDDSIFAKLRGFFAKLL